MADLKISQLSSATALAGTEVVPVVQSGSTKKATIDQILSPASGKGINFSAAGGDTLTIYDEGTWTPADASGAGLTLTVNESYYTRIGRLVNFYLDVTYPSTANGNSAYLSLPSAPVKDGGGSIGYQNITSATQLFANVSASLSVVRILDNAGLTLVNSALSGKRFQITGQYIV